jgi:L-gulonate 3-dehydrogenase
VTQPIVSCIGVGNIGKAWAIAFARGGCRVQVFDSSAKMQAESLEALKVNLADLETAGLIDSATAIEKRIIPCKTLEQALEGAQHVQESIREDLDLKIEIFAKLDSLTPRDVVLASSSSEFMSSQFIGKVKHFERCLVAHPFNPPYLIPLVEISGHPGTSPHCIARTRQLLEDIGMSPVVVSKEIKAFLLNRLQAAVVSEALFLVGEGYCSAEDLDRAMADGLGLRWAFMGPFMTGHLNSSGGYRQYMRDFGDTYRRMTADLRKDYAWQVELADKISDEMEKTVSQERVRDGQRWRDRRLMELLKHKRAAEKFR